MDRWASVHAAARRVTPPAGRYVVVAPHPDDEVLTVGGLILQLVAVGAEVTVIGVTDGGSAYPDRYEHDELATRRRAEQQRALATLGVPPGWTVSMGLRDGRVADDEAAVLDRLLSACDASTTLIAPWTRDHHADHEAVGRAAAEAARRTGCTLWSSIFWAWHHATPQSFDGLDLIRVELDEQTLSRKAAALQCHGSQIRPEDGDAMLNALLLEPAGWTSEYFIVNPLGRATT
ncbi:MAG: PIG-L family deacetylase [Ilumatobacter sp.]|uniref:PIG-L deacetylase family protein n=1 Tax=Ilumatobacter sp. TaxID=1967498 RepID=UPI003C740687